MAKTTAQATRKPATRIFIKHPDIPKAEPVATTVGALEKVWAKKGWTEVDPASESVADAGTPEPAKEN